MDYSKIKNGNDFLMQMFNEQAAEEQANPEVVDTGADAGANASDSVDNNIPTDNNVNDDTSDQVVTQSNVSTTDDDFIDLDGEEPVTAAVQTATQEPKLDLSKIGKSLGIDGIDSEDTLVNKVSEYIKKNKEYEDKLAAYSQIPEQLRDAIELANRGGDYLEYLGISTIDYDAIDDKSLVEEELIGLGLFRNQDGSINEDELSDYVSGLSERELEIKGAQVRNKFKYEQQAQRQAVIQKAEEQRSRAINDMRATLDRLEAVGPFKLNQARKKELMDSFSTGNLMKELFQNEKGQFDYGKAADIYFRVKYAPKIDKLVKESVRNKTIKEQAADIKNVDLNVNTRIARPEVVGAEDPMDYYMRKLQGK